MKPNSKLLGGAEIGERTVLDTHVYGTNRAGRRTDCRIRVRVKGPASAPVSLAISSDEKYLERDGLSGRWREGSSGQFQPTAEGGYTLDEFHATLMRVWDRWHLNDMRGECEHPQAGDPSETIEVVTYGLTTEAHTLRTKAMERLARDVASGQSPHSTTTERALILLTDWFRVRFAPPDADDPLSGCFEVKKREAKTARWVTEAEHPKGMLSKACPVCGYRQGNAWLREALPAALLTWLATRGAEGSPCLDTPQSRVRRVDGTLVQCGDADDPCR